VTLIALMGFYADFVSAHPIKNGDKRILQRVRKSIFDFAVQSHSRGDSPFLRDGDVISTYGKLDERIVLLEVI